MKRPPRLTVYRAADGWRWNYRAANGRIMADSAEAYVERNKCVQAALHVFDLPEYLRCYRTVTIRRAGAGLIEIRIEGRP